MPNFIANSSEMQNHRKEICVKDRLKASVTSRAIVKNQIFYLTTIIHRKIIIPASALRTESSKEVLSSSRQGLLNNSFDNKSVAGI